MISITFNKAMSTLKGRDDDGKEVAISVDAITHESLVLL